MAVPLQVYLCSIALFFLFCAFAHSKAGVLTVQVTLIRLVSGKTGLNVFPPQAFTCVGVYVLFPRTWWCGTTVPVEQQSGPSWLLGWEFPCLTSALRSWPCTPSERCAAPPESSRPQLYSRFFHLSELLIKFSSKWPLNRTVFFRIAPRLWSNFFSLPRLLHPLCYVLSSHPSYLCFYEQFSYLD